jgi:hypothetical protein
MRRECRRSATLRDRLTNMSRLLLALAIVFAAMAISTLIPYSSLMINDFGYHSLCPFAPWSTLVLLFGGGLCWMFRRYISGQLK